MMLRAILVSVDYADLLAVTLPYNRHHFHDVMVVTAKRDTATMQVAVANHCRTYVTDAFYERGAVFNKWLALELALDAYGREGWLCVMDADVLWPRQAPLSLEPGNLYTPYRRMWEGYPKAPGWFMRIPPYDPLGIVPERHWHRFDRHRNVKEWPGYTQIFHASDPALGGTGHWHETDWVHAGGADSLFQRRWTREHKLRPPWEVLHLGEAGQNWYGRATPYLDGTVAPQAGERLRLVAEIWEERRRGKEAGLNEEQRFAREKLH